MWESNKQRVVTQNLENLSQDSQGQNHYWGHISYKKNRDITKARDTQTLDLCQLPQCDFLSPYSLLTEPILALNCKIPPFPYVFNEIECKTAGLPHEDNWRFALYYPKFTMKCFTGLWPNMTFSYTDLIHISSGLNWDWCCKLTRHYLSTMTINIHQ